MDIKIKKMEWATEEPNWYSASAHEFPYGYEVRVTDSGNVRVRFGHKSWCSFQGSVDEAKAAAQADYEARIRAALSAQVQDVAEAVVALKEAEPYVELCHSLIAQKDNRKNVWRVLKKVRAAIAAAPAAKQGEVE